MDSHLISLARAVKRRRGARHPTVWLFTDDERLPDPLAAIAALPRGIAGVVFRHDGAPGRAALARQVAALCRERRIMLVVAGDWRLAASCHAGLHLRGGRAAPTRYRGTITTASAHDGAEIVAARRAGATLVFISPAFATLSHAGLVPRGAVRWARLAQASRFPALALGGITRQTLPRLGQWCAGFGSIGALSST